MMLDVLICPRSSLGCCGFVVCWRCRVVRFEFGRWVGDKTKPSKWFSFFFVFYGWGGRRKDAQTNRRKRKKNEKEKSRQKTNMAAPKKKNNDSDGWSVSSLIRHLSQLCEKDFRGGDLFDRLSSATMRLKTALKDSEARGELDVDAFSTLAQLIVVAENEADETKKLSFLTELFRCFRSSCVANEKNQRLIMENEIIFPKTLDIVTRFLHDKFNESFKEERNLCLRCAVQFWGNLSVNNSDNKFRIWWEIKHLFGFFLNKNEDPIVSNYACMLLCNIIRNEEATLFDLLEESSIEICVSLVDATKEKDLEWGLHTLIQLMTTDTVFERIYTRLSGAAKLYLLEVMKQSLKEEQARQPHVGNVIYLSQEFRKNTSEVFTMSSKFDRDNFEACAVMAALDILCSSSALPKYREELKKDLDFLTGTIYLLRSVHSLGKMGKNNFTPIVKLSAVAHPEHLTDNPVNGLKRDLVRLIGNLCWKCKKNQDHVRNLDGIPLLLDCCNIDARNPFIIQWVVLAIHNLCENNTENQAIIAEMQAIGAVDNDLLKEPEVEDMQQKFEGISLMQKNLDDIKDLFD